MFSKLRSELRIDGGTITENLGVERSDTHRAIYTCIRLSWLKSMMGYDAVILLAAGQFVGA